MSKNDDWSPFDEWWGKLGGTVLFGGVGWWLHGALTELEAGGEEIRVNWILAMLYRIGGKWGAVGFCALLSFLFLFWGLKQLAAGKGRRSAEADESS
ncbi:MAG: hypothetical protein QGG42_15225 [Phycisphaerae bacterium]|jgi:hypothetical protein|nr:hypothetical protein [Phycisphaerae bacterium]